MSKKTKEPDALACRRNKVGGQAVLEGVMMKSGKESALPSASRTGQSANARTRLSPSEKSINFSIYLSFAGR